MAKVLIIRTLCDTNTVILQASNKNTDSAWRDRDIIYIPIQVGDKGIKATRPQA